MTEALGAPQKTVTFKSSRDSGMMIHSTIAMCFRPTSVGSNAKMLPAFYCSLETIKMSTIRDIKAILAQAKQSRYRRNSKTIEQMAEYVDHDLVLTRIREFRNPDGTKKNYRAAKYFTKYSEAIAFADSIRDTDRYLDVKHPINAGQPGIWAVYVLDEWPPPLRAEK